MRAIVHFRWIRQSTAGCLAECFGPSKLPHDKFQRVLGFRKVAAQIYERLPATQQELLNTYAEGVNHYLLKRRFASLAHRLLRIQMHPWSATDSLLVLLGLYQSLGFDLASRKSEFVLRSQLPSAIANFLMSDVDPAFVKPEIEDCPLKEIYKFLSDTTTGPVSLSDASLPGSNCWTLDGNHTASGKPLLACDLHLPPTLPNHWHRIDLLVDEMRVVGVAIPGLPIVVAGSNGSLSWGVTNLPGDTLDLVATDNCSSKATLRRERIKVRKRDDVELDIHETEVGPILPEKLAGKQVVLIWSGLWSTAIDVKLAELAWCKNMDQAVEIATQAGGVPLNIHIVERSGLTAQTVTGAVPRRIDGRLKPHVYIPPAEIGVLCSRSTGILITANDRRRNAACGLPSGWNNSPGFRTRRISELLQSRNDWTEESLMTVQRDVRSEMLEFYCDLALEALDRTANIGSATVRDDVKTALVSWDGQLAAKSRGAPLLMHFRQNLRSRLLAPFVNACLHAEPRFLWSWRSTEYVVRCLVATEAEVLLPGSGNGWWEKLVHILFDSARELHQKYGRSVRYLVWQDVAKRSLRHPLSSGIYRLLYRDLPLPPDGDDDCINVNTATLTVSMRLVVSPGREDYGLLSMFGGQAESPISRHYRDQHRIWCTCHATALMG
jgi:penicillin G amidase